LIADGRSARSVLSAELVDEVLGAEPVPLAAGSLGLLELQAASTPLPSATAAARAAILIEVRVMPTPRQSWLLPTAPMPFATTSSTRIALNGFIERNAL